MHRAYKKIPKSILVKLMSISDEIKKFNNHKMFCTPGHKGTLMADDITEIDGAFPLNYISEAEKKTAKLFRALHLRFLTNGSSIGIKASLLNAGGILANAGCHKSILEAAELAKAKIYFIDAEVEGGITQPPGKRQIEASLKRFPDIQTVVLTAPNYYGLMPDTAVAKIVKKAGKRLHIDGAHAAHMFMRPDLFDISIFKYADTFNLSAHKTLNAYTQTAYLGINNEDLVKEVDHNLQLLGTTSPFYPFMAALENAAEYAAINKSLYSELEKAVRRLKKRIQTLKNDDFTRIAIDTDGYGQTTKEIFNKLLDRGIVAEKYDDRYIIFIVSICDQLQDIDRLTEELCKIRDYSLR